LTMWCAFLLETTAANWVSSRLNCWSCLHEQF
jgi:hypothetical protein